MSFSYLSISCSLFEVYGLSNPGHVNRLSHRNPLILLGWNSDYKRSIRNSSLRYPKHLNHGWITLSGCVDTAGKSGSQTEGRRCQLNLMNGDHRRRRGRALIFRGTGHDNTRRSPGNAILAAIPRRDKHLQVGFLVELGLFPSQFSSSRWSSRQSGEPFQDR